MTPGQGDFRGHMAQDVSGTMGACRELDLKRIRLSLMLPDAAAHAVQQHRLADGGCACSIHIATDPCIIICFICVAPQAPWYCIRRAVPAAAGRTGNCRKQRCTVPPIIEARDVHKNYYMGDVAVSALQGVDLTIQPGEMVAVMGPSGCGKTTLLNCLSGLDSFDQGQVLIEGRSLEKMNDRQRTSYRAAQMGFVFQTYNLLPVISALENVELPLLITGQRSHRARQRAREVLDQVGLAERTGHLPTQLSGGQRQRVAIARALANQPALVWADEPTGNLDEDTSGEILDLMRHLNRAYGQTFVVVTHDTQVSLCCDRTVHMQNGRIVASVPRADEQPAQGPSSSTPAEAP